MKTSVIIVMIALVAVIVGQYILIANVTSDEIFVMQSRFITGVLLLMGGIAFWLFAPKYKRFKKIYEELIDSEDAAKKITQEVNKLTPEPFVLPMEIEITTKSGVKSEKLPIKKREEKFSFKLDGEPT